VLLPACSEGDDFLQILKNKVEHAPPCALLSVGVRDAYAAEAAARSGRRGVSMLSRQEKPPSEFAANVTLFQTDMSTFLKDTGLDEELFGPSALAVRYESQQELIEVAKRMQGSLTATIHGSSRELQDSQDLLDLLREKAGRIIFNGFPTGVGVLPAMVHGGPFPATSDGHSTSVGTLAIERFARPVCFQDAPPGVLLPELQDANPLGIWRMVGGRWTKSSLCEDAAV
jgi:2,5-dioxopentanoate dehydrogenase